MRVTRRGMLLLAILFSVSAGGCGQKRAKSSATTPVVAVINFVSYPILDQSIAGIRAGLKSQGLLPDSVDLRLFNANGQMAKLDALARNVLSTHPTVVVPVSTPVTQAVATAADTSQQIVYSTVTNPSDVGMDKHPPNMTGVSDVVDFRANVDLIFKLFPGTKVIGMVYNPSELNSLTAVDSVKAMAAEMGFSLRLAPVSQSGQVADAARALVDRVNVFYVGSDNTVVSALPALLSVASEKRVPVIASDIGSVEQGALAAVSVDYTQLGRRVADIVAEVIRTGRRAGSIGPVGYVGKTLVLNRKAAKSIGFVFPQDVVQRADSIIQ